MVDASLEPTSIPHQDIIDTAAEQIGDYIVRLLIGSHSLSDIHREAEDRLGGIKAANHLENKWKAVGPLYAAKVIPVSEILASLLAIPE